jgi:DNA gyrase/topoisomerase IV subunit B
MQKIENKYTSLNEIEHILKRSGMYIGSTKEEQTQMFVYSVDESKMIMADLMYTPGLLKIIDEVISNSVDEYRRKDNLGLTKIEVIINHNGHIKIKDNGGIPVVLHKNAKVYVPEFLFGQLRTSSNYNDSEERDVIGTNGIGCKIANIFSKKFSVYTADKKKSYYRSWSNNMQTLNNDETIKICNDHFTEFEFDIDWNYFENINEITEDFISIIEKRCIDAAAANPGLTTIFEYIEDNETLRKAEWNFKNFEEYIELYSDYIDEDNVITFKDKQKQVWIYPDGGLNIGFVNGAECSRGTHIKAIRSEINNAIAAQILQKNKIDIGPRNVDGKYTMFCIYHIANPSYDSQLKNCLTTPVERFSMEENYKFFIPDKFIKECVKSEIVNIVLDWYKQKAEVEDQKTIRKLNKQAKTKLRNSDKFIDANTKRYQDKQLWLFEGDSARAGFRVARDPQTQAAYLLRGKILNTQGLGPSKIMANQELSDIITILGLQWGEKNKPENLNFGKIVIASDADEDGSCICGLLLNFFGKNFPELFDMHMICRSISPIIVAQKGSDVKKYFTLSNYKDDEKNLKGYKITYLKGLGTQTNQLYKEMMQQPVFHYFAKDDLADLSLNAWFGKNNAKERKGMLKDDVE